jgi:hypothetical protein
MRGAKDNRDTHTREQSGSSLDTNQMCPSADKLHMCASNFHASILTPPTLLPTVKEVAEAKDAATSHTNVENCSVMPVTPTASSAFSRVPASHQKERSVIKVKPMVLN